MVTHWPGPKNAENGCPHSSISRTLVGQIPQQSGECNIFSTPDTRMSVEILCSGQVGQGNESKIWRFEHALCCFSRVWLDRMCHSHSSSQRPRPPGILVLGYPADCSLCKKQMRLPRESFARLPVARSKLWSTREQLRHRMGRSVSPSEPSLGRRMKGTR
jgi:hypothetical protein